MMRDPRSVPAALLLGRRAAVLLALLLPAAAAERLSAQARISPGGDGNVSLRLEIQRSIDRGVAFLLEQQDPESGAWGDPELPAFTALSISAILGDPSLDPAAGLPGPVERGYDYLLGMVQPDGGIYGRGLATYNTAIAVMALLQSGKEEHLPVIVGARHLLINQQQDFGGSLFDGGIGYGGTYEHSDLSNTHLAMEALHYSQKLLADTAYDDSEEVDLDWDAAIEFVSRTQNTAKSVAELGWAALREEDEGGFVYFPGDTKSDEIVVQTEEGEKTALRSYGSMTYAGLLAFIYADMDRDDPRIAAALDWLSRNYTVKENPGLDAQGLYYYYHTMAKALAVTGIEDLVTPEGVRIRWREDLALAVMERQREDGSWINDDSSRWMEADPVLTTAYSLLTLQHVYRTL